MLTISRLSIDDPLQGYQEGVGDPITNMGGSVVPTQRAPQQMAIPVATFGPSAGVDTLAIRQRAKRQLRGLLSNTPLKLLGGLYVAWDQDTEQNGWYVPDHMNISDGAEAALAHGFFKAEGQWSLVGRLRTHRRAAQFYIKDLRLSTSPRDYLKTVYSSDFATLSALAVIALPPDLTDPVNTGTGGPFQVSTGPFAMPRTTRDGGTEYQVTNANLDVMDLGVISFEQVESSRNRGDCVIFDRRSNLGPFGVANYRGALLALVPSLYWRHGEAAGTTANDSSGNGRTGTYGAGMTVGSAGLLASDSDKSATGNGATNATVTSTYNPFTGNITVCGWDNLTTLAAARNIWGGTTGTGPLLQVQTNGDANFWSDLGVASAAWGIAGMFVAGATTFWALTWNNTTKVAELFINGVSKGTRTLLNAFNASPGNFVRCGSGAANGSLGPVDETAVFAGTILTPAQIANLYTVGSQVLFDTAAGITDPQAAGKAFTPTDITGCELWADAGQITGLTDGQAASAWNDLSGNGANFAQATGSKQPLYKTNIINGRPVLRFDGVDDDMTAFITARAGRTVFIVAKQRANTANVDVWGVSAGWFSLSSTGTQWSDGATLGGTVTNPSAVAIRFNNVTTTEGFVNGGAAVNTDPNDNYATQTSLLLGQRGNGGNWGNYDIAEIISYSSALSDADIAKVQAYLGDKYGLGFGSAQTTSGYGWEEVYGPDQPLSTSDVPVLQNGRCRVRYSAGSGASGSPSTSGPGFRVDVYNGTTWVEQGFFLPGSASLGNSADFTLTSAAVLEWTPDRAALLIVGVTGGLRVRMIITLQRGWSGPRVEVYNPTIAATSPNITWFPVGDTLNDFVAKNDGTPAQALGVAWSGAGTPSWPATQAILGAATMTGENWFSFIRAAQTFDMTLGVVQVNAKLEHDTVGSSGIGYGNGTRSFGVHATTGLYVQANLSFFAALGDQRQEAESMILGAGTVSSADANASNGNAATTTRTTDANPHVTDTAWMVTTTKYRVFVRVKVSASTGNFYAKTATTTGATVTTASTGYVWLDLGEVVANGTFEIHAWATAAATTSVDCYVAIKVEDRYNVSSNPTPLLDGARDQAQADLIDARIQQTVVARQ